MSTPSAPEAPGSAPAARTAVSDRPTSRRGFRARRAVRFLGTALIVLGIGAVAWTILVWQWQDPFTALYTMYQQHKLAGRYHKIAKTYHPLLVERAKHAPARRSGPSVAEERALIRRDAARYHKTLRPGTPVGRIKVSRLGLSIVLVTGTDHDSLTKGPGWDTRTYLPGEGKLIYIAGHRTTYLAPFAHIDSMRPGDLVRIEVPYGTFVYRVRNHVIVPSDDVARLRSSNRPTGTPPGEVVALQACHPRFFATHRYIVYAVLARVVPKGGKPYTVR
ncbi:MAG TPA: class E sortase [Gaiellaceae bacterium]|nr:class E sortase [Gaiellaceae bacterium]